MKKSIFILTIAASIIAATNLFSCQSSEKKMENAEENVVEAKQDLRAVKIDSIQKAEKAATTEQWKQFKKEAEVKISYNDLRIKELKAEMKQIGNTADALLNKKMEAYEQRNKDLKARMAAYAKTQSDWETFKLEYNHDLSELGKALKDLTVKNMK
jgi:outer membrane murein-binding lipoprotein Lpp/ElaB/YqjD/DUF883 family membrane-anchored ribosome-binding protein